MSDTSEILARLERVARKSFVDGIRQGFVEEEAEEKQELDRWQQRMHDAIDALYYCEKSQALSTPLAKFTSLSKDHENDEISPSLRFEIWAALKAITESIEQLPGARDILEAVRSANAAIAENNFIIFANRKTFDGVPAIRKQIDRLSTCVPVAMPTTTIPAELHKEYRGKLGNYHLMCGARLDEDAIIRRMAAPETRIFILIPLGDEFNFEDIIQIENRNTFRSHRYTIARVLRDLEIPDLEMAQSGSA